MQDYDIETLAVRSGIHRSQFNEHSEALYLTSSFVFENAAEAADRFCNNAPGNIYSRFTNPTVTAFQERLAALEGAQACARSEEHTSELQSPDHLVCRLLLEKKKKKKVGILRAASRTDHLRPQTHH